MCRVVCVFVVSSPYLVMSMKCSSLESVILVVDLDELGVCYNFLVQVTFLSV